MNRSAVCTRASVTCEDCGRRKCDRCGRCRARTVGPGGPGDWRFYCPSFWCRLRRFLPF